MTTDSRRALRRRLVVARVLARSLMAFVPWAEFLRCRPAHSGGDARYYYSVWLRHLVRLTQAGAIGYPRAIAELGPGGSLGSGLAALLGGAEMYYALDVQPFASPAVNLRVFDDLVEMFRRRASIPDDAEFPGVFPRLPSYRFPGSILHEARMRESLADDRIAELRRSVIDPHRPDSRIRYVAPYGLPDAVPRDSVDLVFSQGALCYVEHLPELYWSMGLWLTRNGAMSHQIDFGAIGTTDGWNRHWTYSDTTWRLLRGRRPYWPSRAPHSAYVRAAVEAGFEILADLPEHAPSAVGSSDLAPRFCQLSHHDLTTRCALIVARKRAGGRP